jgi:hypothetical protein
MDLLQYTTYDAVRSLLGLTARELADATLALPHWMLAVELDLQDVDGAAGETVSQYETILAILPASRTAAQAQYFKVAGMYVMYHVGLQLSRSADVYSPVSNSDGKASVERDPDRFEKLRPVLEGGLQKLKERLKEALLVLVPGTAVAATPTRTMILGVGLGADPVTGT